MLHDLAPDFRPLRADFNAAGRSARVLLALSPT